MNETVYVNKYNIIESKTKSNHYSRISVTDSYPGTLVFVFA